MIQISRELELITPSFLGGAEPEKRAEVRASSIRGQLRWWFRVLGGFKSLATQGMNVRQQEDLIFGAAADGHSRAGLITIRTSGLKATEESRDDKQMNATIFDDRGYFLFPLRATDQGRTSHARTVFNPDLQGRGPTFIFTLLWRGNHRLRNDLEALVQVFGEIGSLGFRGRRAMGALAWREHTPNNLAIALDAFSNPNAIDIRSLPCKDAPNAIDVLARWLKRWKAHGRSIDHSKNTADPSKPPLNPGFEWALRDHDEGYAVSGVRSPGPPSHGKTPKGSANETYRSALGLPVVQGLQGAKIFWYPIYDATKARRDRQYKGEGRFASPIILRPHKTPDGSWRALVIFVDAKVWNPADPVFLNGTRKNVSLDLYHVMKRDPLLKPFP